MKKEYAENAIKILRQSMPRYEMAGKRLVLLELVEDLIRYMADEPKKSKPKRKKR